MGEKMINAFLFMSVMNDLQSNQKTLNNRTTAQV